MDQDDTGFKVTFRLTSKVPADLWKIARNYMRGYARKSHWTMDELEQKRGHVALHLKYSPPTTKQEQRRPQPYRAPHPIARRNLG